MRNLINRQRKEVMDINLIEGSFRDEIVQRETPTTLFCKKHDGYTPIIFKNEAGFMGKVKRWLSIEGYPVVNELDLDGETSVTPEEYLRSVWGDKGYEGLPDKLKEALLQRIGVTITIKPKELTEDEEKIYKKLKAEAMLYDANIENAKNLGESKEIKKPLDRAFEKLPWLLAGMGLWPLLQALGILK